MNAKSLKSPCTNTNANRPKKIANIALSLDRSNHQFQKLSHDSQKDLHKLRREPISTSLILNSKKKERKSWKNVKWSNLHLGQRLGDGYISEVAFVKRRPVAFRDTP